MRYFSKNAYQQTLKGCLYAADILIHDEDRPINR